MGFNKMFNRSCLSIFLVLLLLSCNSKGPTTVEIPIALVAGYGGLTPGFGMVSGRVAADNPWQKTEMEVTGLPTEWEHVEIANVWFDAQQFAFQNHKQGLLTEQFFEELVAAWNIDLRARSFSEKPITCFVHVVYGKDREGKLKYKVDFNHNLDFSDEAEHAPSQLNWPPSDATAQRYAHRVKYTTFRNGGLVEIEAPLLIMESQAALWSNIPQHAEAEVDNVRIKISSDGFQSTSFSEASLHFDGEQEEIKQNEFIRLSGKIYQNLGVSPDRQVLRLKQIPADSVIFSSQVGFNARPFSGKDFSTDVEISLEQYQGKFLFIECWGSWCQPCVAELPALKEAYHSTDRSKVEFLGIANDKAEPFSKILEKENIAWKQILCENEEGILDDYNITAYPTSFIIDPKGKIVAKNVRAYELLDTLDFFMRQADW
jgi:thiol-disulfide isomerase/thioredoxin